MLDPRIYRTALMIVVVAVIVVAFSLSSQEPPLSATLTPDAFNGGGAYATMQTLAAQYPDRRPGSAGDEHVADYVAQTLSQYNFLVQRARFSAQTVDGRRTIETVTGTLAGATPGSIVVVAHRDAPRAGASGAAADLSGTAVLLELAQVLSAQTQQRSIVLASTSAQVGAAGAAQLARSLPQPVDAVIVLGDMAGATVRSPAVVPWSDSLLVAPALLRNTVATALAQQAGVHGGDEALGGQYLHLAFPLAASEQRPFAPGGEPAVLVSSSGPRLPAANEPTSVVRIAGFGRAVLQAVTALEAAPNDVPRPSTYLRWQGKLIPDWAVRGLVLALIVPVLVAAIDGLARARRRGYRVARWIAWVLSACLPFVLAILVVLGLRATAAIDIAPPGPVDSGALTVSGRAVGILAGLGCLILAGFALRWWIERRLHFGATPPEAANGKPRARHAITGDAASPGAAAAFLLVLCAVALVMWLGNPFAAGLLVPALHLWLWIVAPEQRPRLPWAVLLFIAGLAPGLAAAYYYATTLGLGAASAAWNAVLMLAGGVVSLTSALEWSVVLGCVISLALMIVRIARQPPLRPVEPAVAVGRPVIYESTLRR